MKKISSRLQLIATYVPHNAQVLDVGSDHALLPIYLVSEKNITPVLASDNKIGPLQKASMNIAKYHLQSQIKLILSDGLLNVEEQFDCLIIAGMGGELIVDILQKGKTKLSQAKTLILQPNNHFSEVRQFLCDNGYKIIAEQFILEKIYKCIIVAIPGRQKLSAIELVYGPCLIDDKPILFSNYLIKRKNKIERLQEDLLKKNTHNPALDSELEMIKKIIE